MKDEIDKREAERLKKQADDAKAAAGKGIDPAGVGAPLEREGKIRERSFDRWNATSGRDAAAPTEREVKIRGLMMDPVTNMPVVVLRAVQGAGTLPIWVGIYEANAIALEIEKVQTPRPMTHDLLKNVLLGLDVRVNKVVVSDLKDDTFYALIWMERGGEIISMDSRPSDALALALRLDCPIFVEEEVFKTSKISSTATEKTSNEELRRWLENLNDEDLGRYKM